MFLGYVGLSNLSHVSRKAWEEEEEEEEVMDSFGIISNQVSTSFIFASNSLEKLAGRYRVPTLKDREGEGGMSHSST